MLNVIKRLLHKSREVNDPLSLRVLKMHNQGNGTSIGTNQRRPPLAPITSSLKPTVHISLFYVYVFQKTTTTNDFHRPPPHPVAAFGR